MTNSEYLADEKGSSNIGKTRTMSHKERTSPSIIEPLQFLLAARRGVRIDPAFSNTEIPDERNIMFVGDSGVKAINQTPFWPRIICNVGYMSNG